MKSRSACADVYVMRFTKDADTANEEIQLFAGNLEQTIEGSWESCEVLQAALEAFAKAFTEANDMWVQFGR